MKKVLAALAAATLWSSAGWAQGYAPPMDMSWAFPWMNGLQAEGDRRAADAAQQYTDYMRWLREHDYAGPSLPSGVTPDRLRESIEGANVATQGYIRNEQTNQDRRLRAIERWDQRVLRGR